MNSNLEIIIKNLKRDLEDLENELEKTKMKGNQGKNEYEEIEYDFKLATGSV